MRVANTLKGISLIEFMIGLAILGIITAGTVASFQPLLEKKRVKKATEELYNDIKFAHSESLKRQSNLYISFQSGADWCYGIDDAGACDCTTANDCQFDGVEKVVKSTDFPGTSFALTGFTTSGGITYLEFEGVRGVATNSGSVTFSRNPYSATVSVNRLGLTDNCSNTLVTYNACP